MSLLQYIPTPLLRQISPMHPAMGNLLSGTWSTSSSVPPSAVQVVLPPLPELLTGELFRQVLLLNPVAGVVVGVFVPYPVAELLRAGIGSAIPTSSDVQMTMQRP